MAEMTSRERIFAAIRREPVDRIPISPRLNLPAIGMGGRNVASFVHLKKNHYNFDPQVPTAYPADLTILQQSWPSVCYTEKVNTEVTAEDEGDTLRITSTFQTPAGTLKQVKIQPKAGRGEYGLFPNPHILEYPVKDRNDIDRMRYLIPPRSTFSIGSFLEEERLFWDDCVPLMGIPGPMDYMCGNACNTEDLMIWFHEDRDLFDNVLNLFADFSTDQLSFAIERGVRNFFLIWFYTSLSAGWSPTMYREVFIPVLKRQVGMIHQAGGTAFMYDDGKFLAVLDSIIEAGVDCIETCTPPDSGDFDIAFAKEQYGDKIAFKGGIDVVDVIARGTPDIIDRTVREYVCTGARGSGLIIGTTDTIRPETPRENIDAFFSSANRYAVEYAHLTQQ